MQEQTIFDLMYEKYQIKKPIRLIEFFAGYGSQALALKYLGVDFTHWKICEWAIKSIQAYKDIHFTNVNNDFSFTYDIDEVKDFLSKKGVSSNYNEPMNEKQIKRMSEKQARTIFNNIIATNNLVNIQQVKGKDLEIRDTDKYTYLLTYSFPCQDLSLAGKGKGMSDTSTRSGMLWEVERILTECKQLGAMPEVLLMENVPQVHGADNVQDFNKWQLRLEDLGYRNYFDDLIATDYGIPQTRNRCFMVSILGDYNYSFPPKQELKLRLKDMLEEEVDEKYYLSDKQIEDIRHWNAYEKPLENMEKIDQSNISPTLTTRSGAYAAGMILIKNATKRGYLEARDGDGIDISSRMQYHRGTVQKGKAQTLTTAGGENNGVVVNMKTKLCNDLIKEKKVEKYDVIRHSYTSSRLKGEMKDLKENNLSPTLDTRCDCLGVVVGTYQFSKSDKFMQGKSRFQAGKDVSDTILTTPKEAVVTIGNYSPSGHNSSRIVDVEHSAPTVMENHGTVTAIVDVPKVLGGIGEKKSNGGTQWYQQDRIYDNNVAISVTTSFNPYYLEELRIRKLTPKECFRLMGVKDEDYDKVAKNQSDASLYHLAGDSIVVDVLMAIFKMML